jgi:hypothetical protein
MKHIYLTYEKLTVSIFTWLFVILSTYSQWSTNPAVNNAICIAPNNQWGQTLNQLYPIMVSDGSGGAIITWEDYRGGTTSDIYAQRIDANGVVQWTPDGVAISTALYYQHSPTIVSDGTGGAIITWDDNRSLSSLDIYAQRVDASGVVQWTANGVAISTAAGTQDSPVISSDGSNGAIISWVDSRSGATDIYAQRINASGVIQWTANGVVISSALNNQEWATTVSDGNGGAIVVWRDGRSGVSYDIYVQRINSSGVVQWTTNGVPVSSATNNQDFPILVSDGSSGAIITWEDYRSGTDIYAQLINATGIVQWTAEGVAISTAANIQTHPAIVSDRNGGAIISWQDTRGGTTSDIYAQRINTSGTIQWTAEGVAISTAINNQYSPSIVNDENSGAIITWYDLRGSVNDIYSQHIDASGVVQWTTNGAAISIATGQQDIASIVSDGNGGAIITWRDYRNGATSDIYSQQVNVSGNLGSVSTGVERPEIFISSFLEQNFPNPFKQSSIIRYIIVSPQLVSLKVYDFFGKEIEVLVNEEKAPGIYEVSFNASKIPSGTYIYRLQTGLYSQTKKMILLK